MKIASPIGVMRQQGIDYNKIFSQRVRGFKNIFLNPFAGVFFREVIALYIFSITYVNNVEHVGDLFSFFVVCFKNVHFILP